MSSEKPLPKWANFVCGGAGGITGWLFVHPMDVLKTRMQAFEKPLGTTIQLTYSGEGVAGFYSGLSAAVMRQITYTTARLGLYDLFRDFLAGNGTVTPLQRLEAGLAAGAIAAYACNPVEVCLVRMQADGSAPKHLQRNYKHVFDALARVTREEGLFTLWRGCGPTVQRAMVVSLTQVASYDQFKAYWSSAAGLSGVPLHITASLCAGIVYSFCSCPFDVTKTKMQQQSKGEGGQLKYRNVFQAMGLIAKESGVGALWSGFLPYYARCGGHTLTMFLFVEQYKRIARKNLE